MKPFKIKLTAVSVSLLALLAMCVVAFAQTAAQSGVSPDEAMRRAAANEEKLRSAERDFSYRQDVLVQTFGEGNSITNQLHRVSELTYDDLGNRVERIIEYPPSKLTMSLGMKPDFKNLTGVEPFFLTTDALASYSVNFIGREKVDELNTYLFEVQPSDLKAYAKRKDKKERLFEGRVWIDDQDFQIVKAQGRAVTLKDEREKFPKFEYYRENVDGRLWLPSLLYADDVLDLKRIDLPIKVEIKYTNYKRVQPRK